MIALALPILQALASPEAADRVVDTTIVVSESSQFRLDASAGKVAVKVWERNAVRLSMSPQGGTDFRIDVTDKTLGVVASAGGRVDEADYVITIPRRMAITLSLGDAQVDLQDCEGNVTVKNYSGRITAKGTKGTLSLKSSMNEVVVQDGSGRVTAQSMYAAVRVTNFTGDVTAEGSANHIYLANVDSRNLTATTISGVIQFSGPLHTDGRYSFSTHSGSVMMTVPPPVSATFHVSTLSGVFTSLYPATREEGPRRGRFTMRVGNGAASVDVETFNGAILVRKPDAP